MVRNSYDGLRKGDLEVSLDEYLSEKAPQFSSDPKFAPYYASRAKAIGSPIKKEAPELRLIKKRAPRNQADDG